MDPLSPTSRGSRLLRWHLPCLRGTIRDVRETLAQKGDMGAAVAVAVAVADVHGQLVLRVDGATAGRDRGPARGTARPRIFATRRNTTSKTVQGGRLVAAAVRGI